MGHHIEMHIKYGVGLTGSGSIWRQGGLECTSMLHSSAFRCSTTTTDFNICPFAFSHGIGVCLFIDGRAQRHFNMLCEADDH